MSKASHPFARLIRVSTTRIDGGNLFGSTAKEKWERFATPDRQNRVAIGNYSMLIAHPNGWVLVNAGPGDKAPLDLDVAPMRSRSSLLREIRELGLVPKDIATVIYTHLHDEHAGGGTHMTSSGRVLPTFPNARYVIQKKALEEAASPNERSSRYYRPDDYLPIEESGQLDVIDGDVEVVKGIRVQTAPGPTAGHQIVVAEDGEATYAFLGTLVPTPMHLSSEVVAAADWNPEATSESKRAVQRHAATDSWHVAPVGRDQWVPACELDRVASFGVTETRKPRAVAPLVRIPEAVAV